MSGYVGILVAAGLTDILAESVVVHPLLIDVTDKPLLVREHKSGSGSQKIGAPERASRLLRESWLEWRREFANAGSCEWDCTWPA